MSDHGLRPNMTDSMHHLRVTALTSQQINGNPTEIRKGNKQLPTGTWPQRNINMCSWAEK